MMNLLQRIWITVLIVAMAITLVSCGLFSTGQDAVEPTAVPIVVSQGTVSAVGRLVPQRYAVLGLGVGGALDELPVAEGNTVQKGDLLARIGDRQGQEAAYAQASAEQLAARQGLETLRDTADLGRAANEQSLVEARAALSGAIHALSLLDTTAFRDRLDDKNVALTKAQDALDKAREELDKHVDLDPANATRKRAQAAFDKARKALDDALYARDSLQSQLELAQAAVQVSIERLADAERRRDATQDGPDPDQLALAEARLAAADASVAAAERALELTELRAPFAGTVVDLHDFLPGMLVTAGAPVVTLADMSVCFVETTDLTELDIVRVSEGQEATVVPDALSELTLTGVVESIAGVPGERSGDVLYTVRIRLNESDPRLRWGMTVDVTLEE
ncbi:MAG: HlyD family efflux transporter periplasmic adaptor subunit [Anaerolineae bacterium]